MLVLLKFHQAVGMSEIQLNLKGVLEYKLNLGVHIKMGYVDAHSCGLLACLGFHFVLLFCSLSR